MSDILDGAAPEFFASGLERVEVMGTVSRFVLYVVKQAADGTMFKEIAFTCILPNEAIAPAIALTLQSMPSGTLIPAVGQVARRLLMN